MKFFIVSLPFFFLPFCLNAQGGSASCLGASAVAEPYSDCVAIFYNNNMLVDDYSTDGKCKLSEGMKGKLTVSAVNLSIENPWPVSVVGFKVAIRNKKTNTIWSYSDKTLYEVELEDILKKCEQGDKIIFITTDKQYALPHNEIEVVGGC